MFMEGIKSLPLSQNEALGQISLAEQRIMQLGANDYEGSAIARIKSGVISGDLSPEEGVEQVLAIEAAKNAYH